MCVLWTWDTCIVVIAHVCTDLNKTDFQETNSGVEFIFVIICDDAEIFCEASPHVMHVRILKCMQYIL